MHSTFVSNWSDGTCRTQPINLVLAAFEEYLRDTGHTPLDEVKEFAQVTLIHAGQQVRWFLETYPQWRPQFENIEWHAQRIGTIARRQEATALRE